MAKILTEFQERFLKVFGKSEISKFFVWSGGAALSFYLRHRLSFDLDFLSKELLPDDYLISQLKKISETLGIRNIKEFKKFNRHEFWLKKNEEVLRVEFVFYPFPSIRAPKKLKEYNLKTDSLEDILTNKAHSIFEREEPKDVLDFYCILRKKRINFFKVFKWVKRKFGVEIDPVIFVSKILKGVDNLSKIKPIVLNKKFFNPKKIKETFEKKAQDYLKKKLK